MHYDAFKCTLKELTTNSVFNARDLRSFACAQLFATSFTWFRSSGSILLHTALSMLWGFFWQLFSLPHLSPWFFFHWYFSVWWVPICCPFYGGSWMGCAVVPAIRGEGVQFISWLPKVKAPEYFRHPTSV